MTSLTDVTTEDSCSQGVQSDLPSLACHAAFEFDNLILNRSNTLDAVVRLANQIDHWMQAKIEVDQSSNQQSWGISSTAIVLMNNAIVASDWNRSVPEMTKVNELREEARKIVNFLKRVVEETQKVRENNDEELKKMSSFCLELSKSASALKSSYDHSRTPRPFKV